MPLGIIIFILILIVSVVTLFIAVSFFINPQEKKLAIIKPMSLSTLYVSLLGLCTGLATSFKIASIQSGEQEIIEISPNFLKAITESFVPPIVGFTFLSIIWLFVAIGMRKYQ